MRKRKSQRIFQIRGTARARAGVLDPTMHGAAPEGASPPHTKAPCAPLTPFLGGKIAKNGRRREMRDDGAGEDQSSEKIWHWQNPICNVAGCYAEIGVHDFFCEAHQAKPNVRNDGVLKPIPLSRLMGRRA